MKKIILLAAATLLAAGLASCTAVASSSEPPAPSRGPDTLTTAPEPEPSFAEAPPADEPVGNLPFGDAVTYEDGLGISVSAPSPYTPADYAAGNDFPHNLSFSITITNGTGQNLDAYAYTEITSGGQSGSQIFDGNTTYPSGIILPGQTLSWVENWSVADPAAIVFSIAPGFDYVDAVFTNIG